ncbi:MAG: tRNA lysidine(34) synthetase TilS [Chitinophagia bacterium]|nr:tRNA lysidine(34) synthetase TilS [Chitinophagia bacterium]
MNLQDGFIAYWKKNKFHLQTNGFLLALSGGMDSMVLATLLLHHNIPFYAAHCNFGLRGQESDDDQFFVEQWCAGKGIKLYIKQFDTHAECKARKKGIEETARLLRYEWFEELRKAHQSSRIITAHHANDNVETVLMNLCKGTGIRGVHGILPDSNFIIRPLLFATKPQIEAYASDNGIAYREDSTNQSHNYLRNKVRHVLIPALTECFPDGIEHFNESIFKLAEAENIYHKQINTEQKRLLELRGNDYYLPLNKLKLSTAIATLVYELTTPYGFTAGQMPDILSLIDAESGHYVASPTHRIIKNRDFLIITALAPESSDIFVIDSLPCTITTATGTFTFRFKDRVEPDTNNPHIAYIDAAAIDHPLLLRKRKTGDYFYPLGMGMKKKKVSKLLIDLKVPIHEKDRLWILESNQRIAWVSGIRLDERFKVKPATAKVLVVKMV